MKIINHSIIVFITLLISSTFVNSQSQVGQPFTASYDVKIAASHVLEKDKSGGILQAINFVPGAGQHSILGEVTTLSIVRLDFSSGENIIEFIETDKDGNSLFVTTKGITLDATTWECYGAIMGGTGKYKTATGHYHAIGTSIDTSSSWTAEGTLYTLNETAEHEAIKNVIKEETNCLLYTSPSPRDRTRTRMPSSA